MAGVTSGPREPLTTAERLERVPVRQRFLTRTRGFGFFPVLTAFGSAERGRDSLLLPVLVRPPPPEPEHDPLGIQLFGLMWPLCQLLETMANNAKLLRRGLLEAVKLETVASWNTSVIRSAPLNTFHFTDSAV